MKLHLPCSLFRALVAWSTAFASVASAATLHSSPTIQEYTDIAEGRGIYRFAYGASLIAYQNGEPTYELAMTPTFTSTSDNGAFTLVNNGSFQLTVAHNGIMNNNTFSARYVGDYAQKYSGVGIRYVPSFSSGLDPSSSSENANIPTMADYRVERVSRLATDATSSVFCTDSATLSVDITNKGWLSYRVGGGTSEVYDAAGNKTLLTDWSYGLTAGIATLSKNSFEEVDSETWETVYSYHFTISPTANCSSTAPLPTVSHEGDSGSPVYIYNKWSEQFEIVGVLRDGDRSTYSNTYYNPMATTRTIDYMKVDVAADGETIYLAGASRENAGETITDGDYSTTLYQGTITQGDKVTRYNGVALDVFEGGTWNAMSAAQYNSNTWYTCTDDELRNSAVGMADLFYTHSLHFTAQTGTQVIELSDAVDLGVGYMQFSLGEGQETATFQLGRDSSDKFLSTSGFIVDKGVTLNNYLTCDAGRELRRVGEGTMNMVGMGDNNVLLNIGGGGLTHLNREGGYAACNVFVGTGATLSLNDVGQVKHNVTLGAGGGTLDIHGNDYTWSAAEGNADGHFSLTVYEGLNRVETSAIANLKEGTSSTLTISREGDFEFAGAFRDGSTYTGGSSIEGDSRYTMMPGELIGQYTQYTAEQRQESTSTLRVVCNGSGTMHMSGVYTLLTGDSGLEVANGRVLLQGTNTIHALGSEDGTNTNRYQNANDWHFAMAEMDVQVRSGASFELGHHALLLGNVAVESGGTYVMKQAVNAAQEFVEGWYTAEDMGALSTYYGHKGNVTLAEGATMVVRMDEGVTTTLNLAGCQVRGEGTFRLERGTVQANLADNLKVGKLVIDGGTLNYNDSGAIATGHTIEIVGSDSSLNLHKWSNLNASSIILRDGGTIRSGDNGFGNNGGTVYVDGAGTMACGNTGGGNVAASISGNGTLSVRDWNREHWVTFNGTIADAEGGSLALNLNQNKVTLTAANTYSGGTTISGGQVITQHADALGTGSITMQGGTLRAETALDVRTPMAFTGSGDMRVEGTLRFSTSAANAITYSGPGAAVVDAAIANSTNRMSITVASAGKGDDFTELTLTGSVGTSGTSFGVNKYGAGTLKLTGDNKFAWGFQLHGGRVIAASDTAFGSGSLDVEAGTTLEIAAGTCVNMSHYINLDAGSTLVVHTLQTDDAALGTSAYGGTASGFTLRLGDDISLAAETQYLVLSGLTTIGNVTVEAGREYALSISGGSLYLSFAAQELEWAGSTDGSWSQSAANTNWNKVDGATSFMNQDTVRFTDTAANKQVAVAGEGVLVKSMEVSGAGYSFSGGTVQAESAMMNESVSLDAGASLRLGSACTVGQVEAAGGAASLGPVSMGVGYIHGLVVGGLATLDNTLIDIAKGVTLELQDVLLTETSRITDDPATVSLNHVTVAVGEGNTWGTEQTVLASGTTLVQAGSGAVFTLADDAPVFSLYCSALDTVNVTGSSLTLDLSGMGASFAEAWAASDYVAVSFGQTEGSLAHVNTTGLSITAIYGGSTYAVYVQEGTQANAATLYIATHAASIPEPATTTLGLLALSLLTSRRRRS